ncbi:MAG: ExbD/TolR family protein [Granulosicoccus sp.]
MNFSTPKKYSGLEIDLTPLINIVFLMLIFFMLAGTLKTSDNIETAEMQSSSPVDEESLIIGLALDGTLSIEGEVIAPENLTGLLKRQKRANGKVAIKPDARLAAAQLLSLSQLLREAGFTQMILIVDSQ